MIDKIKSLFMSVDTKKYFNSYLTYFPTIGKKLKLQRGNKIGVIDEDGSMVVFDSWKELNNVYKLFVEDVEEQVASAIKYFAWGHKTRYNDLLKSFLKVNQMQHLQVPTKMDKENWIYYIDCHGNFCSTSNQMVIDLITHSDEWAEYKLEVIKYTKSDIAKMIGKNVDEFEII